jgi:hypothetical protein
LKPVEVKRFFSSSQALYGVQCKHVLSIGWKSQKIKKIEKKPKKKSQQHVMRSGVLTKLGINETGNTLNWSGLTFY